MDTEQREVFTWGVQPSMISPGLVDEVIRVIERRKRPRSKQYINKNYVKKRKLEGLVGEVKSKDGPVLF